MLINIYEITLSGGPDSAQQRTSDNKKRKQKVDTSGDPRKRKREDDETNRKTKQIDDTSKDPVSQQGGSGDRKRKPENDATSRKRKLKDDTTNGMYVHSLCVGVCTL